MIEALGADTSLAGLFLLAFLAATLLPGGSEIALFAFLRSAPELALPAIALATAGNTLGGLTSYALGRYATRWQTPERLRHVATLQRYGAPALILSWAPLIGDLLCVAGGWLKLDLRQATAWIALGKLLRYVVVAQAALVV